MIWTARYSNPQIAARGLVPIRTSIGAPKFALKYDLNEMIRELMPDYKMLRENREPVYKRSYRSKLSAMGVDLIAERFASIEARHPGKDLVVLCFEDLRRPGKWCHRRMFAEWWQEYTGEIVDELSETATADRQIVGVGGPLIDQPPLF